MLSLGLRLPPTFWLWLLATSRRGGAGPQLLALVWYSLSPLFYERARLLVKSEFFPGKLSPFLFVCLFVFCFVLFFYSLSILQFGLLSHISRLRFFSGHSGQILTLSMQPVPPCPAPTHWWQMQVSGVLLLWQLQLSAYCLLFLFFSLSVMLHSEIPKLPTDLLVRGFPAVWKLLLLHNYLPRTGLHH